MNPENYGMLYLFTVLLGVIVAILWICIPFMVMGINRRLDETNKSLSQLVELLSEQSATESASYKNIKQIEANTAWLANEAIERQQTKELNEVLPEVER